MPDLAILDELTLPFVFLFAGQVWRGRCPVTGKRVLGSNCLELCRWDRSPDGPGCKPNNLVMLSIGVANKMDKEGNGFIDASVRAKIKATLALQGSDW